MFKKLNGWFEAHGLEIAVILLLSALLFLSALPMMLISIDSGHKGVLWRRFFGGTELKRSYGEGATLIFPWDRITIYSMRLQRETAIFNTISKNGLAVSVEASIRYRPYGERLSKLHKYIGPDFVDVLLIPEMGSHIRNIISQYAPEELYSVKRSQIEDEIQKSLRDGLDIMHPEKSSVHYVYVDEILIKEIILPEMVRDSIIQKEQAKQVALTYKFRLQSEEKEKIRKKIEAEGIRDFQNTITDGISQKYLTWKGINATVELAKSNNSKVVIIGSGKSGMPIILGSDYTANPPDKPDKSDQVKP